MAKSLSFLKRKNTR